MDINEAFVRIKKASKNVVDIVVINKDNFIIKSSNGLIAKQMTSLIQLLDKCRKCELTFLKMRTKEFEYLVVQDKQYTLVALLNPSNESVA